MPVFHYRAKQRDGKDVTGKSEAPDVGALVGQLRGQGLVVLDVQEEGKGKVKKPKPAKQKSSGGGGDASVAAMHAQMAAAGGGKKDSGKKRRKVTVRDLAILCRQLSTMLKAGLPIIDALETLSSETENLTLAEILWQVRNDVEGGSSLSEAINRHPKTFSLMFRAMIEAGEASGSLVKIIGQLGEYLKKQDAMAKKIKSATMYPKFVAGFFAMIIAGVLLFLVPQFEDTFRALSNPCSRCYEENVAYKVPYSDEPEHHIGTGWVFGDGYHGSTPAPLDRNGRPPADAVQCRRCDGHGESAPLPMMTQILLAASRFVFSNFLFVIAGFVLLFVLWKKWSDSEQGRQTLDKVVLKIPVAGPLALKAATARWCMTLSTLLSNGVSLDQSLDIVSRVAGNIVLEDATQRVRELIVQGQGLAASMQLFPIYPAMVIKMVSVGEEAGALAEMLSDISEYYEDEVSAAVDGISSVIEPLMIIMLGAIVAVVVLAIYLPIFQMGQAAGGMG